MLARPIDNWPVGASLRWAQDYPAWCWHRMLKWPLDLPASVSEELLARVPSPRSPPSPRSSPPPSPSAWVSNEARARRQEEERWGKGELHHDDVEMQLGEATARGGANESNIENV